MELIAVEPQGEVVMSYDHRSNPGPIEGEIIRRVVGICAEANVPIRAEMRSNNRLPKVDLDDHGAVRDFLLGKGPWMSIYEKDQGR